MSSGRAMSSEWAGMRQSAKTQSGSLRLRASFFLPRGRGERPLLEAPLVGRPLVALDGVLDLRVGAVREDPHGHHGPEREARLLREVREGLELVLLRAILGGLDGFVGLPGLV